PYLPLPSLCSLLIWRAPRATLFPYTTLFRSFTQAGSEVSALLGRIPSAVGYQPTLSTDMGNLQERITSTNKGSITSVQAIYVPRSEEHTSELQSRENLVCRPLLEKKNTERGG